MGTTASMQIQLQQAKSCDDGRVCSIAGESLYFFNFFFFFGFLSSNCFSFPSLTFLFLLPALVAGVVLAY